MASGNMIISKEHQVIIDDVKSRDFIVMVKSETKIPFLENRGVDFKREIYLFETGIGFRYKIEGYDFVKHLMPMVVGLN